MTREINISGIKSEARRKREKTNNRKPTNSGKVKQTLVRQAGARCLTGQKPECPDTNNKCCLNEPLQQSYF